MKKRILTVTIAVLALVFAIALTSAPIFRNARQVGGYDPEAIHTGTSFLFILRG